MKELIITLTIGVLSLSLLTMLVPIKEKTLKYLISVVFLCMITLPVINIIPNMDYEITAEIPDIKQTVLNVNINNIKVLIEDILKRNNLDFKEIRVFANIQDDFSITIKSVEIVSSEKEEKILAVLKDLDFKKVVKSYAE